MTVNPAVQALFSGVGNAKQTDATYFEPGTYLVLINNCKIFQNRSGETRAAIEVTVLGVLDDPDGKALRVGTEATQIIKRGDYWLRDINGFISGVAGCTPEEVTEEGAAQVFADGQSVFAGTVAELYCWNIMTETKGEPFTKHKWRREVKPEEVVKMLSAETIARFFSNPNHPVAIAAAQAAAAA